MCHIHEHFIDGVHMNVLRCHIAQINIINSCAVIHIKSHARRRYDIIDAKFRMLIQFFYKMGCSCKLLPRCFAYTLPVHLPDALHHFEQSRPPRYPVCFQRWGYCKADGLLRAACIRHDKVGSQGIKFALDAFYRSIK